MSALEEIAAVEVAFAGPETRVDRDARARAEREILDQNLQAMAVNGEDFAAFLELLGQADTEYLDAQEYVPPAPAPMLDWEAVSLALTESQKILIGVQNLLSETLAAMGVEDHQFIRVYADTEGWLRLVTDHPRRAEIEDALNSPENVDLRNLYQAATAGMSLAGSLVGTMAAPVEVLERIKAKQHAA